MNAATLEALRGSIAKWEGIVAGTMRDNGIANCPLCKMFYLRGCFGCPVAQRTNRRGCQNTPYMEYAHAALFGEQCEELAQKELDFLKSLLPEES